MSQQQIYNKLCRNLGIIYKCRPVMEEKEVIKMYKAFIQPYFLYGIEVWGHSVKIEKDLLLRLQSKLLRIIFDCERSGDAWIHNHNQIDSTQDHYDVQSIMLDYCLVNLLSQSCQNFMLFSFKIE